MRRLVSAISRLVLPLCAGAGLLLLSGGSPGQVGTDYPNLKGNNARTGANLDPLNSSPGFLSVAGGTLPNPILSSIRWISRGAGTFDVAVDNTDDGNVDQVDSDGNLIGPYDVQPNGAFAAPATVGVRQGQVTRVPAVPDLQNRVFTTLNPNAGWAVTNELNEAGFLYVPSRRTNPLVAPGTDFSPRFAGYEFTNATPSALGNDPRIAADPAQLRTFSWSFSSPDANPRNLALYAWLPIGQTGFGGVQRIQSRYFVYEITYGTGQRYVDVVDTDAAGVGFVRLGGGGRATNAVFPFAGINPATGRPYPVTITLYNTIPRSTVNGDLLQTANDVNGRPRLVYADAARFTNVTDAIAATPTAAGFGNVDGLGIDGVNGGTTDRRVVSARNEFGLLASVGANFAALPTTTPRAVISSHNYNDGSVRWTYIPDENSSSNTLFDETSAAFVPSAGFTSQVKRENVVPPTVPGGPGSAQSAFGNTYYGGIVAAARSEQVTITPPGTATTSELDPGTYEITTYQTGIDQDPIIPNQARFATTLEYEIFENGVTAGTFLLNQQGARGFVRLGNRRYEHSVANPLRVVFYNSSPTVADVGALIQVDAIRFVGSLGNTVNSSPVHARVLIRPNETDDLVTLDPTGPVERNVVIIADEQGRLHCLDAEGRGDGTTKVYWTYPSTQRVRGLDADGTPLYKDPNTNVGLGINDGGGQYDGTNNQILADLPSGFDLSTATVERLTVSEGAIPVQRDYLIVGGTNGRVYCLAMDGRGDGSNQVPGTTYRRWTYPDTSPSLTATQSQFGKITSVVTGLVAGRTRAYFGTELGRFFAIDVLGTSIDQYGAANRATTQTWQYPGPTQPLIGGIEGAPTLDAANNRVFFATLGQDSLPSRLHSLNATDGTVNWTRAGTETFPVIIDAIGTTRTQNLTFGSWRSGPAYVSAAELNSADLEAPQPVAGAAPDTLFCMNENGYVYAVRADNGDTIWRTNELQSGGRGSLGYVRLLTQDRVGTTGLFPTITVPTEGGRFTALYARLGDETAFSNVIGDSNGPRLAWGARVGVPIVASMTTLGNPVGGEGFLYGASTDGAVYAWSGNSSAGGGGIGGVPVEDIVDNNDDPAVQGFRNAQLALLSRTGYQRLRQTQTASSRGAYNYLDVLDPGLPIASAVNPTGQLRAPYARVSASSAFEWGETVYLILYNFPAPTRNIDGDEIAPPQIEVTVTTEGRGSRPILSEARIFRDGNEGPTGNSGYAVVQVPLTSGGSTSLVPGPGTISVAIRTSAANRQSVNQAISLRPGQTRQNFTVANPLAIAMDYDADLLSGGPGQDAYQIGVTRDAASADNINGSPNVAGGTVVTGRDSSRLGVSAGNIQHGQTGRARIAVYDRSLMTLLRGEGRGLDNVRMDRRDLEWQGGALAIVKRLEAIRGPLFAGFEDLPTQIPNVSLDYPDVRRDRVTVIKDPNGAAENPVFNGVSLSGPRVFGANPQAAFQVPNGASFVTDLNSTTRTLVATPFELRVDVPKYQPPSFPGTLVPDSAGQTLDGRGNQIMPQGYGGRFSVYVDSDNNSIFGGGREAYRSFNLFSRVAPDERLVVTTPTIDLGALAGGAGYDTSLGYGAGIDTFRNMTLGGAVSPWGGLYTRLFAPITVLNEGNVNLVNVRLAKGTSDDTGASRVVFPWQTFSIANDENSIWLDSSLDVWSDLDRNFAPRWGGGNDHQVIGQKPRVTDLIGRSVRANPTRRPNAAIGETGRPLLPAASGFESRDPRIGVTIPIGFPIGAYAQTFRIIEDFRPGTTGTNDDELLSLGYRNNTGQVDPQESYSDPGVRVAFTVTETQLTGGTSNLAPKMVDTGNAVTDSAQSGWSSRQPAAARAINGSVAMVFSSDRPNWEPLNGRPQDGSRYGYRLWVSTLAGNPPRTGRTGRTPDSQTRDLNAFIPGGPASPTGVGFWSQQDAGGVNGSYPNLADAALFPDIEGAQGTLLPNTSTFGLPALPVAGFADPATYGTPGAGGFGFVTLAFVGNANRQGAGGAIVDSRLFAAPMSLAANGTATLGDPTPMNFDPTSRKGKPSVVESISGAGQGATIVYPTVSGNASSLYVTRFQGGAFTQPIPIDLGNAFESAGEPSAAIRFPIGVAAPTVNGVRAPLVEIAFSGRLRGRSGNEVFQISLVADPATHLPVVPFRYVSYRVRGERATLDAASGTYRVRGAYLREPGPDPSEPTGAYDDRIYLRGNATRDIRRISEVPVGSGTFVRVSGTDYRTDRESRVETSPSPVLGGQIYLDRGAGSVRSVGGVLPRTAVLLVDYDSYVIRLTGNDGQGYGSPTLMKDTRLAPSNSILGGYDAYWFLPTNAPAPPSDPGTFADRTYVLFTRAAQPGGQTVRPFLATTRFGLRLGREILTASDGTLAETVTVTGANGRYQLDPAAGKIYFTREDEGRGVTVTLGGNATLGVGPLTVTPATGGAIGIIGERAEEPLPLGRAINESNVTAFFDPVFNVPETNGTYARRGLIWAFWSSTRDGAPNVFMGTISPKLVPFVPAR